MDRLPLASLAACCSLVALACNDAGGGADAAGTDGGADAAAPDGSIADAGVDGAADAPGMRDELFLTVLRSPDHSPRVWSTPPALVQPAGGPTFLARTEIMSSMPVFPGPGQLVLSTFGKDGSFGAQGGRSVAPAGGGDRQLVADRLPADLPRARHAGVGQLRLPEVKALAPSLMEGRAARSAPVCRLILP